MTNFSILLLNFSKESSKQEILTKSMSSPVHGIWIHWKSWNWQQFMVANNLQESNNLSKTCLILNLNFTLETLSILFANFISILTAQCIMMMASKLFLYCNNWIKSYKLFLINTSISLTFTILKNILRGKYFLSALTVSNFSSMLPIYSSSSLQDLSSYLWKTLTF